MEQNLNSDKTAARPSHRAVETTGAVGADDDKKLDEVAVKAAKRAGNRFRDDQDTVPGSSEFTK